MPIETSLDELIALTGKQALIIHKQEIALEQLSQAHNQKAKELDEANAKIKELEEVAFLKPVN